MKKMSASSYSLIVIMVLMLAVIISALGMPFHSKLLPLIFASTIFLLSAIKLRQEMSARDRTEATVTGDEVSEIRESKVTGRAYLLTSAWVAGLVLAIYLLGFITAVPLFVFSYMKSHDTRWRTATIFGIITLAVVYFGFKRGLGVDLYEGLLFIWLGS